MIGLCNTTCTVQRATVTQSSAGGHNRTWTDVYVDQPCCIQPRSARLLTSRLEYIESETDIVVYFPTVLDVRVNDVVVAGTSKYNVVAATDMGGRNRYTRVQARRLGP